jgi:hypothetical protein
MTSSLEFTMARYRYSGKLEVYMRPWDVSCLIAEHRFDIVHSSAQSPATITKAEDFLASATVPAIGCIVSSCKCVDFDICRNKDDSL